MGNQRNRCGFIRPWIHVLVCTFVGFLIVGCANNQPINARLLKKPLPGTDYTFTEWLNKQPDNLGELVVMSFSGGGVRAAALAVGSLEALQVMKLSSSIGLISSTSGGSVASAMFAAQGTKGLEHLNNSFLADDNMAELVPKLLPRVLVPGANRSADFADFLENRLFAEGPTKFGELISKWDKKDRPPFVIFNSTDMSAGRTFEFTQDMFSNLCSDLTQLRIAQAVTASAAFPFLINPMLLQNYWTNNADCRYHVAKDARIDLEKWTKHKHGFPGELERARYIHSLQYSVTPRSAGAEVPDRQIDYVHLLDGGLADNLGSRALLRAINDNYSLLQKKNVRSILFVQVNAGSSTPKTIDTSGAIPSLSDVFWSVTLNPIDITTALSAFASREYLAKLVRWSSDTATSDNPAISIYPAIVDFTLLEDRVKRHKAQAIGTSWTLKYKNEDRKETLGFLKSVAENQLNDDPCLHAFINAREGKPIDPERKCEFLALTAPKSPMGNPPPRANRPRPNPMAAPPALLSLSADLLFDFDQATLTPSGKESLDMLVTKLRGMKVYRIRIVGHTDSIGSDIYNQSLSERRAAFVKLYLVTQGIDANLINVSGKGEAQPIADNKTETGRAKNRRIEIEVF